MANVSSVQVSQARHHSTGNGPFPGGTNTPKRIAVPVLLLAWL